jgi:hypothetical protein
VIGATIGALGGVGIAAICNAGYSSEGYTQNHCMEDFAPIGAAVGGGLGAATGALVSKSGWFDIYRAR